MLNIDTLVTFPQVFLSPKWQQAMQQECDALLANAIWD